jgi:hypothetical protein
MDRASSVVTPERFSQGMTSAGVSRVEQARQMNIGLKRPRRSSQSLWVGPEITSGRQIARRNKPVQTVDDSDRAWDPSFPPDEPPPLQGLDHSVHRWGRQEEVPPNIGLGW